MAIKMKLLAAGIILSLCVHLYGNPAIVDLPVNSNVTSKKEQEEPSLKSSELYAKSAVLVDGESGRVLYEKNGNEKMAMASTTKIMTCIVILENVKLDDVVTVSKYASMMPDVQLNIRQGETYFVEDLLYSLMLESHNDAAVALGEYVGSLLMGKQITANTSTDEDKEMVQAFANLMNQKAKEIGCENTYFITPNGLDASDTTGVHSTTAVDLAHIMQYCIQESPKKELFLKITRSQSHSFTDLEGKRSFSCNNHNAFLSMMEGALSGKTGFTGDAGYCYVGALQRDGKTFIVALLACGWPNNKSYKWSDTRKLMEYGLKNYEYKNVWKEKTFDAVFVENGIPKGENLSDPSFVKIGLEGKEEKKLEVLLRNGEEVKIQCMVPDKLTAPIKKGTEVGSVSYYLNHVLLMEYPIEVKETVYNIDFKWCILKIFRQFLL